MIFLPAVPHKRKEEYHRQAENLEYLKCRPDKLKSQIYASFKNGQYKYLAEYALAGSAFFIAGKDEIAMFDKLKYKLRAEYKPYTDKGKTAQKQRNLSDSVQAVIQDLKQTARTREQSINTAKLLFQLADSAVKLSVETAVTAPIMEQENMLQPEIEPSEKLCLDYG